MIRIGGAQMPVTAKISNNVEHLKEAIDWAAKNQVEFLLTPEGSLSGYMNTFEYLERSDIQESFREVTQYASESGIGLALGTEFIDTLPFGRVKRSQIRYTNEQGILTGVYNKQMVIPGETSYPGEGPELIEIEHFNQSGPVKFKAGSFICNDMWGQRNNKQCIINDLFYYEDHKTNILFHASNGFRSEHAGISADESANMRLFSDMHLWNASRYKIPIITVDNCYNIDGTFTNSPTSSQSGIILNGEWLVKANPSGTDYFYYDFKF